MRTRLTALLLCSAATVLSIPSVAQTRYCIGGDLDHLSVAEKSACTATAQAVQASAASMQAPEGWHFVVVCGEEGWKSYSAFSTHAEATLAMAAADTDLLQQTTYFRGDRLQEAKSGELRRFVAHEVAGILLHTDREEAIQTQLATWTHTGVLPQSGM